MLICLDYDKTITAAPDMWEDFVRTNSQVNFIICTNRNDSDPIPDEWANLVDDVYYSDGESKMIYLDSFGIKPDIWIDDDPLWIVYNKSIMFDKVDNV